MAPNGETVTTTTTAMETEEDRFPQPVSNENSDDGGSSPPSRPSVASSSLPSSSSAGAGETPKTDISALVNKSKRAASSLWTLLHAKNCRLGVNRCCHPGCAEAKLIFLHLKTCSVSNASDPCPTGHKGCQDARKLLDHYRRCREIRTRQQMGVKSSSSSLLQQRQQQRQHVCLVCSLVARHAKFSLERTTGGGGVGGTGAGGAFNRGQYNIPSLNLSSCEPISEDGQQQPLQPTPTPNQFSLSQSFEENKGYLSSQQRSKPRFAFSRANHHQLGGTTTTTGEKKSTSPTNGFSALLAASSASMAEDGVVGITSNNNAGTGTALSRTPYQRPRADSMPAYQPERNGKLGGSLARPASRQLPNHEPILEHQEEGQQQQQQGEKSMSYLYLAAVDSFAAEQQQQQQQESSSSSSPLSLSPSDRQRPSHDYPVPMPLGLRRKRSETWSGGSV